MWRFGGCGNIGGLGGVQSVGDVQYGRSSNVAYLLVTF